MKHVLVFRDWPQDGYVNVTDNGATFAPCATRLDASVQAWALAKHGIRVLYRVRIIIKR